MESKAILLDKSNTAEQRIQAAFHLMTQNNDESLDALVTGLLQDPSPMVRHECAYCLGEVTNDKATDALVSSIVNESSKFVIHEAALALANRAVPLTRKFLEPLIDHNDQNIVLTANICLQRYDMKFNNIDLFSEKGPIDLIVDYTGSEELRIQAAFALMKDGSELAIKALINALHSEPDPIVKHEIIFSLGETASQKAIPHLIEEMKKDQNIFVKHEAVLALATLGQKSTIPVIEELLDHPDPDIVESAEISLERLQS